MSTHTEVFSDKWSIKSVPSNEYLLTSVTISGSDGSNGTLPGGLPIDVIVSGVRWVLTIELAEEVAPVRGGIPLPGHIRRFISYDLNNGLVKTFVVDFVDKLPARPTILICTNLDPSLKPFAGVKNPYDFTFDRRMLRERAEHK